MKMPTWTQTRTWSLRGVLMAALVYSAFTFASKPAYATSCDCGALQAMAATYCADIYRFCGESQDVSSFQCDPQTGFFSFHCSVGSEYYGPVSGSCG